MWKRAYAWGRGQIVNELASSLGAIEWKQQPDCDEFSTEVDGRRCKAIVRNFGAEVIVPLKRHVVPEGLRLNEASIWGAQLHEAWTSGEAAQTGHLEFDVAFVVLAADVGAQPAPEKVRLIAPTVRARLLALRPQLWDADVFFDHMRLPIRRSPAAHHSASSARPKHPLLWAAGTAFLGFGRMLPAHELEQGLEQAVHLAGQLEDAVAEQ